VCGLRALVPAVRGWSRSTPVRACGCGCVVQLPPTFYEDTLAFRASAVASDLLLKVVKQEARQTKRLLQQVCQCLSPCAVQ
jgi:hypothetical protein